MCRAAETVTGIGEVDGAQCIRGLWRIYCKSQEARLALLTEKIHLRGVTLDVYDKNPYVKPEGDSTYLMIHDIPLSYDNREIIRWLETHGFPPASPVYYQHARDEIGKLTNFKTGSRYVFIKGDVSKLPERASIGLFTAKFWHPNLKKQNKSSPKCSNCLQFGHHKAECESPVICLACGQEGHRRGECDMQTRSTSQNDITPTPSAEINTNTNPTPQPGATCNKEVSNLLKQVKGLVSTTRRKTSPRAIQVNRKRRLRSGTHKEGVTSKKKDIRTTPVIDSDAEWENCEWDNEAVTHKEAQGQLDGWLSQSKTTFQSSKD